MNQLQCTLTSLEVAEMVGRQHKDVLRNIRNIIKYIDLDMEFVKSCFLKSNYVDYRNRKQPCYLITKKGCELYARSMHIEKGALFAVNYIKKFSETEEQQTSCNRIYEKGGK